MKKIFIGVIIFLSMNQLMKGQENYVVDLSDSFSKLIVSNRINLVLVKGDKGSVTFITNNTDKDKIKIKTKRNTLFLFLKNARIVEKQIKTKTPTGAKKKGIYSDANITAIVTYTSLKALQIRGEQNVTCNDTLIADYFKLKAYGECKMTFLSINTDKMKSTLYGECEVKVQSGISNNMKINLFGENVFDAEGANINKTRLHSWGENELTLPDSGVKYGIYGRN